MNLLDYESDGLKTAFKKYPTTQIPQEPNEGTTSFLLDAPASLPEKLLRLGIIVLALLCLAASRVQACGPGFPNNLLDSGDQAVLVAPTVRFAEELERMQLIPTRWRVAISANAHPQETADAELADLKAALKQLRTPKAEISRICDAYQTQRERLRKYVADYEQWQSSAGWTWDEQSHGRRGEPAGKPPTLPAIALVPGVPEEFADYFHGACEWRNPAIADKATARAAWEKLLARPEAERKFRSTWAAYMLGKSWQDEAPEKAVEYFRQVRALAKCGFTDTLGLATASLGWEARVHLDRSRYREAIHLYLEQFAAGDGSAIESLRTASVSALSEPDMLRELAGDERAQKVITTYLVSSRSSLRFDPTAAGGSQDEQKAAWLNAVEVAQVKDLDSVEKLALAAYQAGAFDVANRWLKHASGTPLTQWLQAKLLLRDGKIAQAATLLEQVSRSFSLEATDTNALASLAANLFVPFANSHYELRGIGAQVLGELGVLRLNLRQYPESLNALLRAGFWGDAAYVAERVLTLDELKTFVDQRWPVQQADTNELRETHTSFVSTNPRESLRYLLARRLTRELRGAEAREYYPFQWQPKFDELMAVLTAGWDETRHSAERARALFTAAYIARTNGMELLGTELGPDWFIHGGNFEYGVTAESRTHENCRFAPASNDELRRAWAHKADPEARFHYRYQAAFLAWEASKLMPDNSDETAFVLWQAGEWLKQRDPSTADGFYKTLVRRCRRTEIGAEADRIRWFPRLDDRGHVIPRESKSVEEPPSHQLFSDDPPPEAEVGTAAELRL